jgi:hypothetical protein
MSIESPVADSAGWAVPVLQPASVSTQRVPAVMADATGRRRVRADMDFPHSSFVER